MIEKPVRETLWTWSTPGVELTYFSSLHEIVLSTSSGARPGQSVPMTSTGGVNWGNVSTLIRGVTTPAKTTTAMQSIRIAIGFRSANAVMDPALSASLVG